MQHEPDEGIVRLSEIGLTDPLHTRLTTGLSPSSWGSTSRILLNLTIPWREYVEPIERDRNWLSR